MISTIPSVTVSPVSGFLPERPPVDTVVSILRDAPFEDTFYELTQFFETYVHGDTQLMNQVFLKMRERIVRVLHCPVIENVVKDDPVVTPVDKIKHLARVVSAINQDLRRSLPLLDDDENINRPFRYLESVVDRLDGAKITFHLGCGISQEDSLPKVIDETRNETPFFF